MTHELLAFLLMLILRTLGHSSARAYSPQYVHRPPSVVSSLAQEEVYNGMTDGSHNGPSHARHTCSVLTEPFSAALKPGDFGVLEK